MPEEDLSSEFDLDSLLDAVVNQQDGRDGVSASVEEGPERVDTVSMANTVKFFSFDPVSVRKTGRSYLTASVSAVVEAALHPHNISARITRHHFFN